MLASPSLARDYLVLLAIGLIFGWTGPYGTFHDLSLPYRFAYWISDLLLTGSMAMVAMRNVPRLRFCASWPVPVQAVLAALMVAVPGIFVTYGLETIFRETPPLSPGHLAQIYFSLVLAVSAIGIPWRLLREREHAVATPAIVVHLPTPASGSTRRESPFLERIPLKLGRELLSIATEDHYLRVTTPLGHDLILYRLSDAIAELDPALGQQVHRSFWVARHAIASVERDGQRTTLVLTNGAKVPVSRTYVPALREAGWLKG